MKTFCNSLFLIATIISSSSFLTAGNEPPQKKRRIENVNQEVIETFEELETKTTQYRTANLNQQIFFLNRLFIRIQNPIKLAAALRELLPYTKNNAIFAWLAQQLIQKPLKDRIAIMYILEYILEDFGYLTEWNELYKSLVQPDSFVQFPEKIYRICEARMRCSTQVNLLEINKLTNLANRLNQITQPEELTPILAQISTLQPRKQAFFLNETFHFIFRSELTKKQEYCHKLLLHLKALALQTDDPATNLYIMKIAGRITFEGLDHTSRNAICSLANNQCKIFQKSGLSTEQRDVIVGYLNQLIKTLQANAYWQGELPATLHLNIQKQHEAELLNFLQSIHFVDDATFIKLLSNPIIKPLILKQGTQQRLESGIPKPYSYAVFYSQGSRLYQKFTPEAQIAFLQALQKRTDFAKYSLLGKTALWNHIIDDAVAIEFLKTIATMPEDDQMEYLLQDETDCNSNIFEPYYTASKLSSNFWQKFAKHTSTFSLQNQARFFASKLFQAVLPHIRQTQSVEPNLAKNLQQLTPHIQWLILRNDSFLGRYLLDAPSTSHLLETINLLPEKIKCKILQKIISIFVDLPRCADQSEIESMHLMGSLSAEAFIQLVNAITTLSPQSKIKLLSANPKTLYRLIKYMNTPKQKAAVEHLLTSLKKTALTKQLAAKQKNQLTQIFYSLISLLLKKPQIELSEEEYYSYAQIPDNLPIEKQSVIVEQLLCDSIRLISEKHVPDTDQWIHHHYILNATFDFLEQNKKQYEIKTLLMKLKQTALLKPINEALTLFYHSSFIKGGAKQVLEETGLTDTYADNSKKLKKIQAKVENTLVFCGNKFAKLQQEMSDQTDLRTYFRIQQTQKARPFCDIDIHCKKTK